MSRLVDEVTSLTVTTLLLTLAVVGAGTAGVMHLTAQRAQERAMIAAVLSHRVEDPDTWRLEHTPIPVEVWTVKRDDDRLPSDRLAVAKRSERPQWWNDDTHRWLLATVEQGLEEEHDEEGEDDDDREHRERRRRREVHALIAARADRIGWTTSVGPFLAAYTLVAMMVGLGASARVRRRLGDAFTPLERARADALAAVRRGHASRLEEDGPDEVRDLLASMNTLLERLDTAYRSQVRFTAEAAHELRTPVTAMLGELDVALRRERDPETYDATLRSVHEEVARMRRLVEALTTLARLDGGQVELGTRPVDLQEVVAEACEHEWLALEQAGCALEVDIPEAPMRVEAHPDLLLIAITNLLRNASVHAAGAPVRVSVSQTSGEVSLHVDDGGPGVPEADRSTVFARFARGDSARAEHRDGLGLGLALTNEVLRHHGGHCAMSVSPLGGCRVTLVLPLPA